MIYAFRPKRRELPLIVIEADDSEQALAAFELNGIDVNPDFVTLGSMLFLDANQEGRVTATAMTQLGRLPTQKPK